MKKLIKKKTFIDLFCGIGGFRLGMERNGFKCVFSNDNNKYASSVYRYHFGGDIVEADIKKIQAKEIPEADILCGGFPCQSFSIAGKGRGFKDPRGDLFFEICRIAEEKKIPYLFLENVRGILSNKKGGTFCFILKSLCDIGYDVQWKTCNSKNYGVPQNRERVFIIGHFRGERRPEIFSVQNNVELDKKTRSQNQETVPCLEATGYKGVSAERFYGVLHQIGKIGKGGMGQRIYDTDGIATSVRAEAGGQGAKTGLYVAPCIRAEHHNIADVHFIPQRYPLKFLNRNQKNIDGDYSFTVDGTNTGGVKEKHGIRRLTPTECERLQSFPDSWTRFGIDKNGNKVKISDTQRYKMLGNAVTVNVIEHIAKGFKNI